MYNFFNAQSKLRDAAQWGCGGWKSSTARPFSDDFGEILAGRRGAPRRMHSVRAGCSYFLVTSPRAISIMECGQKINTQFLAYYYKLLSPFLLIFHMLIEIPRYKVRFCALSLANEHYSEKFKETLDFFWMNLPEPRIFTLECAPQSPPPPPAPGIRHPTCMFSEVPFHSLFSH